MGRDGEGEEVRGGKGGGSGEKEEESAQSL